MTRVSPLPHHEEQARATGGGALSVADIIDRSVGFICRAVILLTGLALLVLLTANVVARYVMESGGFRFAQELPERLFPWFIMAGRGARGSEGRPHGGRVGAGPPQPQRRAHHATRRLRDHHRLLRHPGLGGTGRRRHRVHRDEPRARAVEQLQLLRARARLPWGHPDDLRACAAGLRGSVPRPCRPPIQRRQAYEHRSRHRLHGPHAPGDPRRARPRHCRRRDLGVAGGSAADDRRAADVSADAVLSDARLALLHDGGQPDAGRQARRGTAELRHQGDAALARRPALDHSRGLGRLRRRLGKRGRQCERARIGAHPLAEAAGLSGRAVRRQQRHVGGHRHPDPALDPADPLFARQRRQHRRSVHRRHSAGNPDGGWAHPDVQPDRAAARHPFGGSRRQPDGAPEAGSAERPGSSDADPDSARPALRHRNADRDLGSGGRLCARAQRASSIAI